MTMNFREEKLQKFARHLLDNFFPKSVGLHGRSFLGHNNSLCHELPSGREIFLSF